VRAYKRVGESKLENLTDVVACKSRKLGSDTPAPTCTVSRCATVSESATVVGSSGGDAVTV